MRLILAMVIWRHCGSSWAYHRIWNCSEVGEGGERKEYLVLIVLCVCLHVKAAHFAQMWERERNENERKKSIILIIIIICKAMLLCFTIHDTVHALNISNIYSRTQWRQITWRQHCGGPLSLWVMMYLTSWIVDASFVDTAWSSPCFFSSSACFSH